MIGMLNYSGPSLCLEAKWGQASLIPVSTIVWKHFLNTAAKSYWVFGAGFSLNAKLFP